MKPTFSKLVYFFVVLVLGACFPFKRKKRIERNETAQPAGTVPEMQARDFCFVKSYPILRTLSFYKEILKVFSNMQTFPVVVDTVMLCLL